jgi:hypothetical protein
MLYYEWAILAGLFVLTWVLIVLIGRSVSHGVNQGLQALDLRIAEALKSLVEGLPIGDLPEINPFQQFMMNMIEKQMEPSTIVATEIQKKGDDGKFISDNL